MLHKTFDFSVKAVDESGVFSGYVSVFNNKDIAGDIVLPGAFSESLAEWKLKGALPPVLWQHKTYEPIGPFTKMFEDENGLFVEGKLLVDDIPRAKEARALLVHKAIRGMSIGYSVVEFDYDYDENGSTTYLKKLNLFEGSIVTFPANELAIVDNVKEICSNGKLPSLKEFEGFLRESGFSRSQATAIASKGLRVLLSESGVDNADILSALKNFKLRSHESG